SEGCTRRIDRILAEMSQRPRGYALVLLGRSSKSLFVLFTRGGVDWLPHNELETGHKGKSGSEEIDGQGGNIGGPLVIKAAYDVDQHSRDCRTSQNDKNREYGWWRTFSYSFSASVRIGQEESQHRNPKTRRGNAPKQRFRNVVQSQDRRQQRSTAQRENLN